MGDDQISYLSFLTPQIGSNLVLNVFVIIINY